MADMTTPLHQQVHDAWKTSGLSQQRLLELAGLDCTSDSLSRKLRGLQILTTAEAEKLAAALGIGLSIPAPAMDEATAAEVA